MNTENENNNGTPRRSSHDFKPILTAGVCAIGVLIFLGLNLSAVRNSPDQWARWGISSASEIRSGHVWGLVTPTFAHFDLWHLAFNMYWLWRFGIVLERTLGRIRWTALYLFVAVITCAAELTVTGEAGIGASGIVYGFFGFLWVGSRSESAFDEAINQGTIQLFLAWLVICFALTYTNVLAVANAAHLGGLFAGALAAAAFVVKQQKPIALAGIAALTIGSSVGLFWAPWNASWTSDQAIKAFKKDDLKAAEYWTRRTLAHGSDKTWSYDMLMRIATAADNKTAYTSALEDFRAINPAQAEQSDKKFRPLWTDSARNPLRNTTNSP